MIDLSPDQLLALAAYAAGRRADLTATRLGEARNALAAAGLVRDCSRSECPMYVTATDAGRQLLAELAHPVQLELFALDGGAR